MLRPNDPYSCAMYLIRTATALVTQIERFARLRQKQNEKNNKEETTEPRSEVLCWWLRTGQNARLDQIGTQPNYVLWTNFSHSPQCFVGGVGGGGGNNVRFLCVPAHMQDVTLGPLGDLLLHLHTCHMRDVTLGDFLLHLHTCHMRDVTLGDHLFDLHTCGMLR